MYNSLTLAFALSPGDLADAIEEEKAKQADYDALMKTKREDEVLLKSAAEPPGRSSLRALLLLRS